MTQPDHPTTVLAAVVRRGKAVLIGLRPHHKRHGGLWEFPGGKVKRGETWFEAIQRELREELSVEVLSVGDVLFCQQDADGLFEVVFLPVKISGEPIALEHQDLRWAMRDEALQLPLAPADRAFLASTAAV